jgi:hypothetical protein
MPAVAEPNVSRTRWTLGVLAGLIVFLIIPPPTLLGSSDLGALVIVALAIGVTGLIVRARSLRRWLIVALVTGGLALALLGLSRILIPF